LECYFFKEGYIRTSSMAYDLNDIENEFVHLTNNAIQKHSPDYSKFEDGNQLSFKQFIDILVSTYGKSKDFFENEIL
jgi:hypothetical protein